MRDADDVRKCVFESRKCDKDDEEECDEVSRVIGDDGDIDSSVPTIRFKVPIFFCLLHLS